MSILAKETKVGIYPRFNGTIPQDAQYGLCNVHTHQWTGDWIFTDEDAWEQADDLGRSGLPIAVLRVGGNPDNNKDWVEQSGF